MEHYGMELVLDLKECNTALFTRRHLRRYIKELCTLIGMKRMKLVWWDYFWVPKFWRDPNPKTYGTSVVQFIMTSNITIHTLDKLGTVYINIFSCNDFDVSKAMLFSTEWFEGQYNMHYELVRGQR